MNDEKKDAALASLINEKVDDFVRNSVGDVIKAGGSVGDVSVLMENAMTGAMMVSSRVYRLKPHVCVGLAEVILQRAIERFVELQNKASEGMEE